MSRKFYGSRTADCIPVTNKYPSIYSPKALYDALSEIWCAETCAPRMRDKWTPENKTKGQCSITAFLAQDIFGGKVYGIPLGDGSVHCYNVVGDRVFDLTSEQFGEKAAELVYENNPEQSRDGHFAKEEKRLRYEYLSEQLAKREDMLVRPFTSEMTAQAMEIWNEIVEAGEAFPQDEPLNEKNAAEFFRSQSFTGAAFNGDEIAGLYILHPNNVGRCGHICNASFAVRSSQRGKHIGERLVRHCINKAAELDFRILQFNAVVADNLPALALYKKLGFTRLGVIPKGFRGKNGEYSDIIPHYIELERT